MSDFLVREEQDDFTTKLSKMVAEGQQDQALDAIAGLDTVRQQLIMLQVLAHKGGAATLQLRFDLAMATILCRPPTHDLARDLVRAVDLALESVTKRDMIRTRNIDLTRALVRAVDLARALDPTRLSNARILARTLDLAYNLARESEPDFASDVTILSRIVQVLVSLYSDDWAPSIMREQLGDDYFQKLADALDESLYLQQQNPSNILATTSQVLQRLIGGNLRHVTLEGVTILSPDALANTVAPYLQALSDFLRLHSQLTDSEFQALRIIQIDKGSCKIELTGIGAALDALIGLSQLGKRRQEIDIRETAEAAQTISAIQKEAEFEVHKTKKTGEIIRYHLERAHHYIETYAPDLSFEERLPLVIELADALKRMGMTGIKLRFGWHDTPRPPQSHDPQRQAMNKDG